MSTNPNKAKKKPTAKRTSGKRKSKNKGLETEEEAELASPLRPAPRPRITLRLPVAPPNPGTPVESSSPGDPEQDAISALVLMGGNGTNFESRMDEGSDEDKEESESDSGSDSDEESGSEDNDLADAVPVSSPARAAQTRKNMFIITFEVPFKGACRELEVTSITSFKAFLDKLAVCMSTRKSLLDSIAYIPSYTPKTPKPTPKLLEDKKLWKKLVEGVAAHIAAEKDKKKGKGTVKPFTIQIVDTSGGDPKAVTGGKKVGHGGKKEKVPAAEPDPVERKEQQFYRELEHKYHCAEHDRPCAVLSDGNHYHLTNSDLAKWAYLIGQHRATKEDLPRKELKIDDAVPRQHAAKKAICSTETPVDRDLPSWIRDILPLVGMAFGSSMHHVSSPFETPQHPPSPTPQQPSAGTSRLSALIFDPPSSGTKRAAAEAAPGIGPWLSSLDRDIRGRGRHNLNYFQYCDKFEDNSIYDLTDMENMAAKKIGSLIGCNIGVANHLVKYATEDTDQLAKDAKRARHT
ncbi:hypothetical protein B0H17DRAFT_1131893 [Mycena rosella]|uniref:Uncharacterized protein n=1 Tax=Mycena rosella TaxID=1033263 RepID=A0AAD7GLE8_MYCRO|nr:hypothetical protein B0H17DRAFT_1131893 [Mycena rosella]